LAVAVAVAEAFSKQEAEFKKDNNNKINENNENDDHIIHNHFTYGDRNVLPETE